MSLFWTRHHSLALNALSSQESPPSPGILLVSCIAFIAFERLHDPTGLGGRYIDYIIAGLSILRERSESQQDRRARRIQSHRQLYRAHVLSDGATLVYVLSAEAIGGQ